MLTIVIQPENLLAIMTAIAVFATIMTIAIPILTKDTLNNRMKSVALEREKLRAQHRGRAAKDKAKVNAKKKEAAGSVQFVVEKLNLRSALADQSTEDQLVRAGYRGPAPLMIFLALRIGLPIVFASLAAFYLFIIAPPSKDGGHMNFIIMGVCAVIGFYLPVYFVRNRMKARQLSITRAWPDALDLCLICVESGMSIEVAFRRVAAEIGPQSVALAEELMITTAELSFLPERKTAYDNLTYRTGLEAVKNVVLSLTQAEKYGTPLATALRVLSQESRDTRLAMAEKKAAALPPKLTVPMMVCFLPVLFCVILTPAIIRSMKTLSGISLG